MYTDEMIQAKYDAARQLRLSGCELLSDFELVRRDCNGIGAAWMPDWAREAVRAMHPSLVLAADIHDRRYGSGGSESDRKAADDEFEANGLRIAEQLYHWYDPRRWLVRHQTKKFAALLRMFGRIAYRYEVLT